MIATNKKVERLIEAITEFEGWEPPSEKNGFKGSRSYRNHNPGNLRASPFAFSVVDNFAVFKNDFVGYMALHWDLMQKSKGNTVTGLNAQSSLRDLFFVYAPPSDNNHTEEYVAYVAKSMGVNENITLGEIFKN